MQVIFERLLEVLIAMFLAGVVLFVYNGLTNGNWQPVMVMIVPLGLMWAMFLSAMTAVDMSKGLFLLSIAMLVLVVYLVARFVPRRAFRLAGETVAFVAFQLVQVLLFAAQGVSS